MAQKRVLWGRASSANVQKPLWALEELGLEYERIDAGGKYGRLETDEYAKLNPNRLIPVLQEDDLVLWESNAIVRYLAAQYGAGTLWPEKPRERALADQWSEWVAASFQPAWLKVFVSMVRTRPEDRDMAEIGKAVAHANAMFALMNDQLGKTPYLGGETFTYADILAGVSLYRWTTIDIARESFANVDAWHARLKSRPAFEKTVCVSYAELIAR